MSCFFEQIIYIIPRDSFPFSVEKLRNKLITDSLFEKRMKELLRNTKYNHLSDIEMTEKAFLLAYKYAVTNIQTFDSSWGKTHVAYFIETISPRIESDLYVVSIFKSCVIPELLDKENVMTDISNM